MPPHNGRPIPKRCMCGHAMMRHWDTGPISHSREKTFCRTCQCSKYEEANFRSPGDRKRIKYPKRDYG